MVDEYPDEADPHVTLTITPAGVELGSIETGSPAQNLAMLAQVLTLGGRLSLAMAASPAGEAAVPPVPPPIGVRDRTGATDGLPPVPIEGDIT